MDTRACRGRRNRLALSLAICSSIGSRSLGRRGYFRDRLRARDLGDPNDPQGRHAGRDLQTDDGDRRGGPYRFTRNPIYLGMVLGQIGVAVAFDSLWILATLVVFYLVIRYGVVAREEAYLERKFGDVYLGYKSRVRRWL